MAQPPPPPSPLVPGGFEHGDAVGPVLLGVAGFLAAMMMIIYIAREPTRSWPEYFMHRSNSAKKATLTALFQRCVAEFIGTFFLTATIELTAGQSRAPLSPLAIGSTLMCLTFALGHVSGGHFNPAITLAVLFRGKIEPIPTIVYIAVQLVGAFGGAAIETMTLGDSCINANIYGPAGPEGPPGCGSGFPYHNREYPTEVGLLTEFLYSFMLATVYLNVSSSPTKENNQYFGLAVGFAMTVGAVAAGDVSGGVFNPAVGTALPAIHGNHQTIWMYWIGPCLGMSLAAFVFRFVTGTGDAERYLEEKQRELLQEQQLALPESGHGSGR